ncbi:MAG: hypothetical protein JXB50_09620 [Spirochaetes bacterium]|nr:hypothetical protein [Spirochaetota bacterium]
MKLKYLIILLIVLFSCEYNDPFIDSSLEGKDLISRLDFLLDWTNAIGIATASNLTAAPPGETLVYSISLQNLVSYTTFENSTGISDFGTWQEAANPPENAYVEQSGTEMYGSKYLYLEINRSSVAQYFYHNFTSEAGPPDQSDYVFKFDYRHLSGGDIQLSFGQPGVDELKLSLDPPQAGGIYKARFDVTTMSPGTNYQVRFGFSNNTIDSESFEIYVDNAALFIKSPHTVSKNLYIQDTPDHFNDGTGEDFFEGKYRFECYVQKDTSVPDNDADYATIILGPSYKSQAIGSSWQKISIENNIYKSEGVLTIAVMPVHFSEIDRMPGTILITKPKLFFLNE